MATGLKSWELENAVKLVDPNRDSFYKLDLAQIKKEDDAHPWRDDPHYFQEVCISAIALLKMTMHARSGGELEIMGLMQGYFSGKKLVVTDALRLPVEGTETRVNAGAEADEYIVNFLEKAREAGQLENPIGWYHSHPGYGCWLSGIDVQTEMILQSQGPWCAIVIDPDRTISAGKVEIGAFRTFPENYKPEEHEEGDADAEGFQTVPLAKIEDFGAHSERYYSLEVSHFKSTLDTKLLEALWNKYWVSTLSSSPLFTNRDFATKQMAELARKMKGVEKEKIPKGGAPGLSSGLKKQSHDEQLKRVIQASNKIVAEEESGLLTMAIKERLFRPVQVKGAEDMDAGD